MSSARPKTTPANRATGRTFTWAIKSTDINFMKPNEGHGTIDGCTGSDCSMVSPLEKPRKKKAAKGSRG